MILPHDPFVSSEIRGDLRKKRGRAAQVDRKAGPTAAAGSSNTTYFEILLCFAKQGKLRSFRHRDARSRRRCDLMECRDLRIHGGAGVYRVGQLASSCFS